MKACDNLTMRKAHVSEAGRIAAMSRLHIEHGLNWRWTPQKVRRHIRDAETMVLVASIEGEIAGFAIMRFGDNKAHLYLLAVEPKMQRRGIGRSMLEWLEQSCVTAGISHVRLELRKSNRAARAFYASLGYRYIGEVGGYYDKREAAVIMARSLYSAA
jgi:ribosomal-protein-alanine N-acetyltransferase